MEIRRATKDDIENIKKIVDRNFDDIISKYHSQNIVNKYKEHNSIESLMSQLNWKKMYVMIDNGNLVGTGAFANFGTLDLAKYSISNLYVLPELHGKGIGTQLVNTLLSDAKDIKAKSFHVPSTRNAIPFYEKCGFAIDEIQIDKDDEITWMTMWL